MNLLNLVETYGLTPKKHASIRGGEYKSPCPACGGTKRFTIQPEYKGGRYWCRDCPASGDVIQFMIDFMGLTFREAAERSGKELPERPYRHRVPPPNIENIEPMEAEGKLKPVERWRREAAAQGGAASEALKNNPERQAWLTARGIGPEVAKRFGLGWVEEEKFYSLRRWGLPTEKNSKGNYKRLWIPRGYLISQHNLAGEITMLQVRMETLLPKSEMRYYPVKGSTVTPMILPPDPPLPLERTAWVIVESRLDAILIAAHAGDLVGVMAQGSSSANPCRDAVRLLDGSPRILVALDADGAGDAAYKKWQKRFKTARRFTPPAGKDPGDYVRDHSGDIRSWIMDGLPPGLKIERKAAVPMPQNKKKAEGPDYYRMTASDGRVYYLASTPESYQRLEAEKKPVFSPLEIERVKSAVNDGVPAGLFLDIKEIFGGGRLKKHNDGIQRAR